MVRPGPPHPVPRGESRSAERLLPMPPHAGGRRTHTLTTLNAHAHRPSRAHTPHACTHTLFPPRQR
eukprot:scaffold6271_cov68-Phaeocystis_antarctica.AAC.2